MEGGGGAENNPAAADPHPRPPPAGPAAAGGRQDQPPEQPPPKRLCLEYLGGSSTAASSLDTDSSRDSTVSMDNSSEVVTKIAGLYAERLMSDVILVVGKVSQIVLQAINNILIFFSGKQELAAHRLILCASSEVFQIMLMNNSWTEASEKKIVLKESPECEAVFEVFLKYLYTGKISVNYSNVIPILQLADKYNVKDLLKVGLNFMSRNVPMAAKKNQVVSWYQFTTNCGYKEVARQCLNFIKWNFDLVSESIDWPNMQLDSLVQVLASSDLVTLQEVRVFRSVERWLTARRREMEDRGEDNIGLHMERLTLACMGHVRYTLEDLSNLLTNTYNPSPWSGSP